MTRHDTTNDTTNDTHLLGVGDGHVGEGRQERSEQLEGEDVDAGGIAHIP